MNEEFFNKVENIVAKREIAHHEQVFLMPQCFQKPPAVDACKCVYMYERVKFPYSSISK